MRSTEVIRHSEGRQADGGRSVSDGLIDDVRLSVGASISGTVVDATGGPVFGAITKRPKEDRFLAIQKACRMARPGDLVLVAGKGHETYQVVNNQLPRRRVFQDSDLRPGEVSEIVPFHRWVLEHLGQILLSVSR